MGHFFKNILCILYVTFNQCSLLLFRIDVMYPLLVLSVLRLDVFFYDEIRLVYNKVCFT